jgi:hypothetical protein
MNLYQPQNSALAEFHRPSPAAEELSESIKFFPHDRILRTLGSLLQQAGFREFDLRVSGGLYTAYGQVAEDNSVPRSLLQRIFRFSGLGNKGRRPVVRRLQYSISDILNCETESRQRRQQPSQMPDPFSAPEILRGIGRFLDRRAESRLLGLTVKNRWVAVDYVAVGGSKQNEVQDFEYFYNYGVKMYMRRSNRAKLPPPSDPTLYVCWEPVRRQHTLSRVPT